MCLHQNLQGWAAEKCPTLLLVALHCSHAEALSDAELINCLDTQVPWETQACRVLQVRVNA